MWKEKLPSNCPPSAATESTMEVYRILKDATPTEDDFKPYARIYMNNPRYKTLCSAYAISFYNSIQNAKTAWKDAFDRGNNLGSHIGQFTVLEIHGKNQFKQKTGHYSSWFYSSWDFKNFNPSFISAINDN